MDTVIEQVETTAKLVAPSIGAEWQGGIYAGILGGVDGQPDQHIIKAPIKIELEGLTWQQAIEAGEAANINGFFDWSLPDRRESRLIAINAPDGFSLYDHYWTSTQGTHDTDFAWLQDFNNGGQDYNHKLTKYRAFFVRRILIIQ